jgi:hypothetical protein
MFDAFCELGGVACCKLMRTAVKVLPQRRLLRSSLLSFLSLYHTDLIYLISYLSTMAASSRDFVICGTCSLVVRPSSAFVAHSSSTEHLERTQGNFVRCPVCSLYCTPGFWSQHAAGKQHRKTAQRQGLRVDVSYEVPSSVPGHRKCHSCSIFIRDNQWEDHQRSTNHLERLRAQGEVDAMRETLRQAAADKGGVFVSQADGVDFGVVDTSDAEKGVRTLLRVKTAPDSGNIKFVHVKILPTSSLASADSYVLATFRLKSVIDLFFQVQCPHDIDISNRYSRHRILHCYPLPPCLTSTRPILRQCRGPFPAYSSRRSVCDRSLSHCCGGKYQGLSRYRTRCSLPASSTA